MKHTNFLIYGFAAFAAFFAYRTMSPGATAGTGIFDMLAGQRKASGAAVADNSTKTTEILSGTGGSFSNGWKYYTDGTAIGPDGKYYFQGAEVWSPA